MGATMNSIQKLIFTGTLFTSLLLAGCAGTAQQPAAMPTPALPTSQPAPSATASPEITAQPAATGTPAGLARIKVETYNILYGGGFDERVPADQRLDNRLKGLLDYISVESPDILGLQELNGWELGDPQNMAQFAKQLNMNGYLATDVNGFHNGLLTKYEIIETKNLSPILGNAGGMYARLNSPIGPINVFNVHNDPFSPAERTCQSKKLMRLAEAYKNEPTFLMGDFNDFPDFNPRGWVNPVFFGNRGIDQIWVSPAVKASYEFSKLVPHSKYDSTESYDGKQLYQLSDHMPVAITFTIEAILAGPETTPTSPTPNGGETLPAPLAASLNQPELLDSGQFNRCASLMNWQTGSLPIAEETGLTLTGKNDWAEGFGFRSALETGQGMLVDFTFAAGQPEFEIHLDSGEWQAPDYRRFGATISGGKITRNIWEGPNQREATVLPGSPSLVAGRTYSLFVGVGQNNQFVMVFWDKQNPAVFSKVSEAFGQDWDRKDWRFSIGANSGEIVFPAYTFISFDGIQADQ
jgi:hypothetical protein